MDEDKEMETESGMESSDEEDDAIAVKRAEEIEGLLGSNIYLYDLHVELVKLYKDLVDLVSLRQAYQRFHETYPLTDTLWLEWLKVEMQLATSEDEKKYVFSLFEKATLDYLSVKLWLEYAQYALGCCSLEETREIIEKGLNAVGLHVCNGSLLWDTLRELELANLSITTPDSKEYKLQLKKVTAIFRRQLSVPLLNMEGTYEEWKEFLKNIESKEDCLDVEAVEWGYKNALKLLDTYKPFEEKLIIAANDEEIYNIFKEYIKSVKDPSVILCLYERAVEKLCLLPTIWLDYCYYAYKLGECSIKISERAIRNVTWSEDIWILRLRILEKNAINETDIVKCYQDGISSVTSGLELWISYLDYIKRNAPDRLFNLLETAEEQVTIAVDPMHKITRLHARLLFKSEKISKARSLWNSIMHDPICKQKSNYWLELIGLERQFGSTSSVREAFKKACNSCTNELQLISDEWLLYEREYGTIDDIVRCTEKLRTLTIVNSQPIEVQEFIDKKRKKDTHSLNNKKFKHNDLNNKTTVVEIKSLKSESVGKFSKSNVGLVRNQAAPVNLDAAKSVFISNIGPHVTAKTLQPLFPTGVITLCTNNKGTSRCFAYIQFETEQEAEETLKRDREPLEGRPIFISQCKTNKAEREKTFHFSDNVEFNKLFIKGLPFTHKKEDVEKLFKEFNCTDVRLVLHKNGHSKGLAYVDFANEIDASEALKKTNQMQIGEFIITVAISAPPTKKSDPPQTSKAPERTMRLFVPRSVSKAQPITIKPNGPMKSNNDFRNMLFKK